MPFAFAATIAGAVMLPIVKQSGSAVGGNEQNGPPLPMLPLTTGSLGHALALYAPVRKHGQRGYAAARKNRKFRWLHAPATKEIALLSFGKKPLSP
jgi:hypothetical protein